MKQLSKQQIQRKNEIAEELSRVGGEIMDATTHFNAQVLDLFSPIEELKDRYNELVAEANTFLEETHEEQERWMDDRSDDWRDGDAGQIYGEWAVEWSLALEEIDLECPGPLEEPELDAAEIIRDLPEHP